MPNKIHHTAIVSDGSILDGDEIEIGPYSIIGPNVIIGNNVSISENCLIGNDVHIMDGVCIDSSVIGNKVTISQNTVIGKNGFGFHSGSPNSQIFFHIGGVKIGNDVFIGSNCNVDRGHIDNTTIGDFVRIDNQVHIAHNNKIGDNCIIAGQVGFAGSSILGNNVMIGGQAGISGHLNIGNNIKIGGGSGVIKDIPDNSRVMGYPAKNLREFLREN